MTILLSTTGTYAARSMPMSSHIPFTALCISGISTTTIGMYSHAHMGLSKPEDLRAKKRAQISHAQSARNEAQKTYWTGDVGHPKAGVSGGGTGGAVLDQAQGMRIPGLSRARSSQSVLRLIP